LSLDVAPGAELTVRIKYNQNRFSAAAIERVARDLELLAGAFARNAGGTLADLTAVLDAAERQEKESRGLDFEAAKEQKLRGLRRRAVPIRKEG
jgi:hypothetical protein